MSFSTDDAYMDRVFALVQIVARSSRAFPAIRKLRFLDDGEVAQLNNRIFYLKGILIFIKRSLI